MSHWNFLYTGFSTCLLFSLLPLDLFYPAPMVAFLYLPFGELFLTRESSMTTSLSYHPMPALSCIRSLVLHFKGSAVVLGLCFSTFHHYAAVLNNPVYPEELPGHRRNCCCSWIYQDKARGGKTQVWTKHAWGISALRTLSISGWLIGVAELLSLAVGCKTSQKCLWEQ